MYTFQFAIIVALLHHGADKISRCFGPRVNIFLFFLQKVEIFPPRVFEITQSYQIQFLFFHLPPFQSYCSVHYRGGTRRAASRTKQAALSYLRNVRIRFLSNSIHQVFRKLLCNGTGVVSSFAKVHFRFFLRIQTSKYYFFRARARRTLPPFLFPKRFDKNLSFQFLARLDGSSNARGSLGDSSPVR